MRTRPFQFLAATAALALAVPAASASAEGPEATVTFEVTGGTSTDLSLAFVDGEASSVTLEQEGNVVSGDLPRTVVTDNRFGVGNTWTVHVSTADHFWREQGDGEPEIAVLRNRAHVYLPTTSSITSVLGGLNVTVAELPVGTNRLGPAGETATADLDTHSYQLVGGTSLLNLTGRSAHQYTPVMSVELEDGQVGGTYTGTVKQSLG